MNITNGYFCGDCDLGFCGSKALKSHLSGNYHAKKVNLSKGSSTSQDDRTTQRLEEAKRKSSTEHSSNTMTYHCDTCDVSCTGIKSYNMHLEGQKHLKKTKKLTSGQKKNVFSPVSSSIGYRRLLIQPLIDKCEESLIGLDYLTEFQRHSTREEPTYVCDLCSATMDPRQVISHITGVRHRRRYMKHYNPIKHEEMCAAIKQYGQAAGTHLGEVYAKAAELREGRTTIRLKVQLLPEKKSVKLSDENLTSFDNSLWEEVGKDGMPLSKVCTGPVLQRYTLWSENHEDDFSGSDMVDTSAAREFSPPNENNSRQRTKRSSTEFQEQFPNGTKRMRMQSVSDGSCGGTDYHRTDFHNIDTGYRYDGSPSSTWNSIQSEKGYEIRCPQASNYYTSGNTASSPLLQPVGSDYEPLQYNIYSEQSHLSTQRTYIRPHIQRNQDDIHRNFLQTNSQHAIPVDVHPTSYQLNSQINYWHPPHVFSDIITRHQNDLSSSYNTACSNNDRLQSSSKCMSAQQHRNQGKNNSAKVNDTPSSSQADANKQGGNLTKCIVKNEKDAAIALKVSNVLTKALAQYKLDTFLNSIKDSNISKPDSRSDTLLGGHSFSRKEREPT